MHKSQVFRYFLLSLLAGVAIGSFWTISSDWLLSVVAMGAVILGASAYHRTFGATTEGMRRRKIGFVAGVCVLLVAAGIWRFNSFSSSKSFVEQFSEREVARQGLAFTLRGYVDGPFDQNERGGQFPFRVKEIIVPRRVIPADERILVQTERMPEYEFGDFLTVVGVPRRPENTTDFDYRTYLRKDGIQFIVARPEIRNEAEPLVLSWGERQKVAFYRGIFVIKGRFLAAVRDTIPDPAAAYVGGILLGERGDIPEKYQEAFRDSGVTHVLAISGYNIAIIAEVVLLVLVWIVRRRVAFWISLGAIAAFVIMTGASASVVRAGIMGILFIGASGYGRLYDARNALLLAGAIMAYINPWVLVFDLGFQLSFLAVLGLLYVYPVLRHSTRSWLGQNTLAEMVLMTLAAQVTVLPLLMYTFGTVSLVSIAANIAIVPFVPYLMFFGFLAGIGGLLFLPLGEVLGVIAWALAHYQLSGAVFFASLPGAAIAVAFPWYAAAGAYLIGGSLIWRAYRRIQFTHG